MAKRGDTRANKYAGACRYCGTSVPTMAGIITLTEGGWKLSHRPAVWVGLPAGGSAIGKDGNGSFVGGCPKVPATV